MCYDVSFTVKLEEINDYFPGIIMDPQINLEFQQSHIMGTAVFPDHPIVFLNKEDNLFHCKLMSWSCIEFYAKEMPDMKKRNGMLNIRSERILDDPKSYWYKIRNRRCLIPLSGTFEHRAVKGLKKKVPYLVKPKDQSLFFLPGLYSVVEIPDKTTGEIIKYWTFGLITTRANDLMRTIHNSGDNPFRMPLFLSFDLSKEFISADLSESRYREILGYQMPSEDLYYHTTDTIRTSKLRADNKEKHEPFIWPNLPPLGEMNPDTGLEG